MRNEGLRMLVIADDITGAAEIAGMAYSKGQQVRLLCADCTDSAGCTDSVGNTTITVIATDTRSMTEAEATAETRRLASFLISHFSFLISPADSFLIPHFSFPIYKKADSALRGHVVAELEALMKATGFRRAVYMPANPSKGRIIRDGIYYIDGKPIHETAFSYDPEFPACTSSLRERFPDAAEKGIVMPDATTMDDICHLISHYDDGNTLFAGAADLFAALMEARGRKRDDMTASQAMEARDEKPPLPHSTLILCGSTQSRPLDLGIPIASMPREVYDGQQDADYWFNQLSTPLLTREGPGEDLSGEGLPGEGLSGEGLSGESLLLAIPFTHRTGKAVAIHLRTVMAEMARRLVSRHHPDSLIIEGGATAWATLNALGWHEFQIERQVAPGVVQMRSVTSGTLVTLKPGSYPWGGLFDKDRQG